MFHSSPSRWSTVASASGRHRRDAEQEGECEPVSSAAWGSEAPGRTHGVCGFGLCVLRSGAPPGGHTSREGPAALQAWLCERHEQSGGWAAGWPTQSLALDYDNRPQASSVPNEKMAVAILDKSTWRVPSAFGKSFQLMNLPGGCWEDKLMGVRLFRHRRLWQIKTARWPPVPRLCQSP